MIAGIAAFVALAWESRDDEQPTADVVASTAPEHAHAHPPHAAPGSASNESRTDDGDAMRSRRAQSFATAAPDAVLSGDAVTLLRQLTQQAEGGDAQAAFDLFRLLSTCAAYADVERLGEAKVVHRAEVDGCERLMDASPPHAVDALRMAAQLGSVRAQVAFAAVAGQQFASVEAIARDVEAFGRYRAESVQFLESAARQGSVEGMLALSDVYREGVLVPADPVRALAYREAAYRSGLLNVDEGSEPGWVTALSQAQRQRADALATAILDRCCGR